MSERWTAETEELVRDAAGVAQVDAAAILTAIADAGLLLASGGETREEIGHLTPGGYVYACGGGSWSTAAHAASGCESPVSHTSTVTSWADGSRHIGPWLPVSDGGGA